MRRELRWACSAVALALCGWLTWSVARSNAADSLRPGVIVFHDAIEGEALIHGVPKNYSRIDLPLASVPAAVLFGHRGVTMGRWVQGASLAVCALVFLAAALLEPAATPFSAAAALLFLSASRTDLSSVYAQAGYAPYLLLAAGLLVYRARKPDPRRTLLLSLGLGAALLFRSVLFLFPAVLAGWELLADRGERVSRRGETLILLAAPLLFLIPWLRLGWSVYRDFTPFEFRQVQSNIVTGALGFVQTIEGDWRLLIKEPFDESRFGAVYLWAARQIALHPWRYLAGYAARVRFAFDAHPWLFVMAFFSVWLERRRREVIELGLLAAYFVGVHCFMTVQYAYFIPLWPLLCVLAAPLAGRLTRAAGLASSPLSAQRWRRLAAGACVAALAAALCLCAYCEKVVWVDGGYAREASLGERLEGALREAPNDSWLNFEAGKWELGRGRLSAAASDFRLAAQADRACAYCRLYAAWTDALERRSDALFQLPPPRDPDLRLILHVQRAQAALERGRRSLAREELLKAHAEFSGVTVVRDPHVGAARQALADLDSLARFENCCLDAIQDRDSGPLLGLLKETFGLSLKPAQRMPGTTVYTM